MERLQKALNRARSERDRQLQDSGAAQPDGTTAPPPPDPVILTRTRVVPVDPAVLSANGVMPADASGSVGQAFKMLRTQVLQRMQQQGWNTLAVLSPSPEDGKTYVAINLAIEQCLSGEVSIGDALVSPQGYLKLLLLPALSAVNNSSESLASERTRRLTREIKNRYVNRVVLFDLPPVLGHDDALAFAPQVDAALVVVAEEHTRREDLLRCFEILRNIPIIGTVLNASRTTAGHAYAY